MFQQNLRSILEAERVKLKGKVRVGISRLTANLLVGSDGKAKFTLNQSSQYKNIEIITIDFSP